MTAIALSPLAYVYGLDYARCYQCDGRTVRIPQGTLHMDFDRRVLTWEHTRAATHGTDYTHAGLECTQCHPNDS